MALKIRLSRGGSKKRPYYRIVVAESSAPRDGRFVEKVGTYNPLLPREHENRVTVKADRVQYWLSVGAKPTDRVARFLSESGLMPALKTTEKPKKSQPKAKALERLKEKEEKEAAAREAAEAAKAEPESVQEEATENVAEEAAD